MLRPKFHKNTTGWKGERRYGFTLERPDNTRSLFVEFKVFDRKFGDFRCRGFDLEARRFG